jgi:endoglucanase
MTDTILQTIPRRRAAEKLVFATAAALLSMPAAALAANPFANTTFYVDPYSEAQQQADAWRATRPADAAQMDKVARQAQAYWFGDWNPDVKSAVNSRVTTIVAAGAMPVLVAYNIPDRDCSGYSVGGAATAADYKTWIRAFASGIAGRKAAVVLEPDALAMLDQCSAATGSEQARLDLLKDAVQVLKAQGPVAVYIDAGNAGWTPADEMATRLRNAGVAGADGFATDVSNFRTNAEELARGRAISALVGGKHFVVDTSRNGLGAGSTWCNPDGRAVGERPGAATDDPILDAYLWLKRPGESDGVCNGGPDAGVFWPAYALGLAQRSSWELSDPTLRVGNASVTEDSAQDAVFTVSLSAASQRSVTVKYATVAEGATTDVDFLGRTGTLTFAPGVTSQTVSVTVRGDVLAEGNETFALQLSEPLHARFAASRGTATIVDDDGAAPPPPVPAPAGSKMTAPAAGSSLAGASATFQWTGTAGATEYWLSVGSTLGAKDLYDGTQGLGLSRTVGTLPTDGRTLYVRLFWRAPKWVSADYTYTASKAVAATPRITSPTAGSTIHGGTATFTWSSAPGVTQYWLSVGTSPGAGNVYDATQGVALTRTLKTLPKSGTVYVRLWWKTATTKWTTVDTTYVAAP